jgi:hypothetical protein
MKTRLAFTILLFVVLLGLGAPAALAAPRANCASTGNGNWNTTGTWTCGHVPTSSDNVTINNGHTVTLDSAGGAAYQLIVGGGSSGTLTHDTGSQTLSAGAGGVSVSKSGMFIAPETLTIAGDLTNNGLLLSSSGTLTINGGNFTNNGSFFENSGTIAMGGSVAKSIGGANLTFYNLTINNSAGVNLTTNASVDGTLTLNYDLNVSSGYALTMGIDATTQGNADVVGKTGRPYTLTSNTPYTFGSPYTTIRFTGGTLPSEITVELFKSAPGGLANAVQRYYSITPTGGSGYTFDLQLHYRDSELGGINENYLQMWQQVNGSWTLRSVTSRDTTNNWVQKTGLTSFSLWAVAAGPGVCVSTGTGNWDTAGTWTCGHVPTGSDIVIINNGHTITLNTDESASQLIVGVGSSGTLTHDTGSQTLTVGAGGVSVSNGATFNAPETLNLAGNLTNNGTFNATGSTVVMNGTGAPQSIGGSNLTFNNLQIATNAVVNLTTNATVNGTLTLDSDLNVSSGYALTMGSSATTQGNADVVGKTRRASLSSGTAYSFGSPYTTIQFASGGTLPSEITVELFKSAPGGLANAVQRYYSITPTGGSGYTFDLQLHYRDSELGSVNENNLQMWQQVDGRWTLRSVTSRDTTNNWVQKNRAERVSRSGRFRIAARQQR